MTEDRWRIERRAQDREIDEEFSPHVGQQTSQYVGGGEWGEIQSRPCRQCGSDGESSVGGESQIEAEFGLEFGFGKIGIVERNIGDTKIGVGIHNAKVGSDTDRLTLVQAGLLA